MKRDAVRLLEQARASLADHRLLAEHRSANASLLLDLSLKQALASVGVALGRNASDGLPLDTLLGLIPSDHPASVLAGRLADPRARTASLVGDLLDALGRKRGKPPAAGRAGAAAPAEADEPDRGAERSKKSDAEPGPRRAGERGTARKQGAEQTRGIAGDKVDARVAGAEPATVDAADEPRGDETARADGPTAFEVTTRRRNADAAHASEQEASSAAFWSLMDRWSVDTETALALLGSGRALTQKKTRPRFRLRGEEARRFGSLQRIDTALGMLGETPDWLQQQRLGKRTAWQMLLAEPDAAADRILHALNRLGLRGRLTDS